MPGAPEVPEVPPLPPAALEPTAQMAAAWDFLVSLAEVIGSVRLHTVWESGDGADGGDGADSALMPGLALLPTIWGDGGDAGPVR